MLNYVFAFVVEQEVESDPVEITTDEGWVEEQEPDEALSVEIQKDSEMRFEVATSGELHVKLMEGQAELFGTELVLRRTYIFPAAYKGAIFSFYGATVKVWGEKEAMYVSSDTQSQTVYVNIHAALQQLRKDTAIGKRKYVI